MSVSTHRIYEVLVENIGKCTYKKELAEKGMSLIPEDAEDGYTIKVWDDYENRYRILKGGELIPSEDCEHVWKMVRWYTPNDVSDSNNSDCSIQKHKDINKYDDPVFVKDKEKLTEWYIYTNQGGYIRDNYISSRAHDNKAFNLRGLPKDISPEAKKYFDANKNKFFSHTYVTVAELEDISEALKEQLLAELTKEASKNNLSLINKKLDVLFVKVKDRYNDDLKWPSDEDKEKEYDDYDEEEDTIDDIYWELRQILGEIYMAEAYADSYLPLESKLRIIYFLSC